MTTEILDRVFTEDAVAESSSSIRSAEASSVCRRNGKRPATDNPTHIRVAHWLLGMGMGLSILFLLLAIFSPSPSSDAGATNRLQPALWTKPIEQIQLGERVIGENPNRSEVDPSLRDPDPETWRTIKLTMVKANGGLLKIDLLRPLEWLEQHKAKTGTTIFVRLPEIGEAAHAKVEYIGPCTLIQPPPGNVVTGRFIHKSDGNLLKIKFAGHSEEIGVTSNHPFWSADRQEFVAAGELSVGETVDTTTGRSTVVSVIDVAKDEPIYNLEVHNEHVYRVGLLGILVHNNCPAPGAVSRYTRDVFEGRNIYRAAGDFDLDVPTNVDAKFVHKSIRQKIQNGWTNADLMRNGNAPIGRDGRPINLHHVLGDEPGPMVELLGSTHSRHHRPLHGLIEDGNSFRNTPGLENQYNAFRARYWRWRVQQLTGE